MKARIIALDDNGQPTDKVWEGDIVDITITGRNILPTLPPPTPDHHTLSAHLDALCRCGHRRRLHGGEGGSCEVFQCACTHFTATPPIPRTDP